MTSIEFSFVALITSVIATAYYGIKRYKSPLNPLTIFSLIQMGLFHITSGLITLNSPSNYDEEAIEKAILISFLYLVGTSLPYMLHGNLLSRSFAKIFYFFGLNFVTFSYKFSFIKFIIIILGAIASFVALMYFGSGGLMWLTNTREAYIQFRSGAGMFYALTQWLLTFSMIYYIWFTRPKALKLISVTLLFSLGMYFLGSKNNLLTLFVIAIFYYNFYVQLISYRYYLILIAILFFVFFGMLILQGSFPSFLDSVVYFRDYFDVTVQMLYRFDELGFRYGEGWITSLWFYVPRALYPSKPYEYGLTLIHQVLFPGAAESGATPSPLPWAVSYLDFGILGVFIEGLLLGIFQRATYEFFLKNKQCFFAFVLAIHFSIWPVWTFSPLIFVIALSIFQSLYLRLGCQSRA